MERRILTVLLNCVLHLTDYNRVLNLNDLESFSGRGDDQGSPVSVVQGFLHVYMMYSGKWLPHLSKYMHMLEN